jgi:hypothetical protein
MPRPRVFNSIKTVSDRKKNAILAIFIFAFVSLGAFAYSFVGAAWPLPLFRLIRGESVVPRTYKYSDVNAAARETLGALHHRISYDADMHLALCGPYAGNAHTLHLCISNTIVNLYEKAVFMLSELEREMKITRLPDGSYKDGDVVLSEDEYRAFIAKITSLPL